MPKETLKKRIKRLVARPIKSVVRDFVLWGELPRIYAKSASRTPVDTRKVLFVDDKSLEMPSAFSVMLSHLQEHFDLDVRFVGLGLNSGRGYEAYLRACRKLAREAADARLIFLADASNVISCLPLRPETKVVQLWHACGAYKKWGYSTAELKFGGTRRQIDRHPYYKNLDLVSVSSPAVEWAYREAMGLEDEPSVVQALGTSRTDLFFDERFLKESRLDAEAWAPGARGKRILLYAPTFRGSVSQAQGPDFLDIRRLRAVLGDGWFLLVKQHPFVKTPPPIPEGCEDFAAEVSEGPEPERLLAAADALLTDYSSVLFEYSLLGRPMALLIPDAEDYCSWRGFYYAPDDLAPGRVLESTEDVVDWLCALDPSSAGSDKVAAAVRSRFMSTCDGHSTERICRMALGPAIESLRRAPVAERMAELAGDGPDITIVIPAFNAEGTLPRTLASVATQDYPSERMELIVADDCSTDGTRQVAERFMAAYPGPARVLSTARQSGTPAVPRNIGLAAARGEYVLFLDADDWLGPEAIRRMLGHALDWGSDVLLVKLRGEGGRDVPKSMFTRSQPAADIERSKVMWTLAPLKLFRRSTVKDIRFPEGCMPEDISFALRAYSAARIVSVAADYDYYHVSGQVGKANASITTWRDAGANIRAYEDIFACVAADRRLSGNGPLLRRLFGRDVANTVETIAKEDDGEAVRHLESLVEVAGPFYDPDALATLPSPQRELLDAVFGGDEEGAPAAEPETTPAAPQEWSGGEDGITISVLTPACNSERHLAQCLECLSAQDIPDAEFICIDDGSTDSTRAIMDRYAARDPRFRVVSHPNKGYGASMNRGLSLARGRYVGVLESDDWLERGALSSLTRLARENAWPDIVKANHYSFDDATGEEAFEENYAPSLCGRVVAPRECEDPSPILSTPAIWAAIYRRDFLSGNGIGFLETPGASFQDTGFVFKAWAAAERVYITRDAYLHYRSGNEGSSTVSRGKALCVVDEWDSIDEFADRRGVGKNISALLAQKKYQTFAWNLRRLPATARVAFARAASLSLARDLAAGRLEERRFSPRQWGRVTKWAADPDGIVLDAAIAEESSPLRKALLRARRKARTACGFANTLE